MYQVKGERENVSGKGRMYQVKGEYVLVFQCCCYGVMHL